MSNSVNTTAVHISKKLLDKLEQHQGDKEKILESHGNEGGNAFVGIMFSKSDLMACFDAEDVDFIIREVVEIMKSKKIDAKAKEEDGNIKFLVELGDA